MGKRRGRGEGSIFQRGDGLWEVQVSHIDEKGRRRRRCARGKTKREAQEALGRLTQAAPLPGDLDKLSVASFLKRWLEHIRQSVEESTADSYSDKVRLHISPMIGHLLMSKVTPLHVQSVYAKMAKAKLSGRSRQYVHTVMRMAFSKAVQWGVVDKNVTDAVDAPKKGRPEFKVLSEAEVGSFLANKSGWYRNLFSLALHTGARQGELFALEWRDVDLKAKKLQIRRTVTDRRGGRVAKEPKTRAGRRTIDIPDAAVEALNDQRMQNLADGQAASLLVFPGRTGFLSRSAVDRALRAYLKEQKLPALHFHELRHTHLTLLLTHGIHPKVVQERAGHSTIGITLDTYSHVLPQLQNQVAEKINKMFG